MIKKLRQRLVQNKKSVYRIAQETGLGYNTCLRFIRGDTDNVSMETATKLAESIGYKIKLEKK